MNHSEYTSDELLPLSGIQHFLFCRRQWALIYVERLYKSRSPCGERGLKHRCAFEAVWNPGRSPCGERGLKH